MSNLHIPVTGSPATGIFLCPSLPQVHMLGAARAFLLSSRPHNGGQLQGGNNLWHLYFNSAVTVLQTLVIALGAGLGIWGAINLLEGYGNDNPGANAHVR